MGNVILRPSKLQAASCKLQAASCKLQAASESVWWLGLYGVSGFFAGSWKLEAGSWKLEAGSWKSLGDGAYDVNRACSSTPSYPRRRVSRRTLALGLCLNRPGCCLPGPMDPRVREDDGVWGAASSFKLQASSFKLQASSFKLQA